MLLLVTSLSRYLHSSFPFLSSSSSSVAQPTLSFCIHIVSQELCVIIKSRWCPHIWSLLSPIGIPCHHMSLSTRLWFGTSEQRPSTYLSYHSLGKAAYICNAVVCVCHASNDTYDLQVSSHKRYLSPSSKFVLLHLRHMSHTFFLPSDQHLKWPAFAV